MMTFEPYFFILIVFCTLLGLAVGSFLNVAAHRLPMMMRRTSGLTLWSPPSYCPECHHSLSPQDMVPLLSYFLLKGKCRYCSQAISKYYPLVELTSALLSGGLAWHFGPTPLLIAALCLTWALITLAAIDLTHFLLPDSITLPLLWLGLAVNWFHLIVPLSAAVLGAMLGYIFLWSTFHLFKLLNGKEGMGYGDFKLLAVAGAWLGYQALPMIIVLSALIAILVRIIWFRPQKYRYFAFGPYLCFAILIVLFWRHFP